ncbi:hypothetical protein [[Phormidium] sp. ETS-05]|nr:hypothetical protein [[Phormidium] sp. ETS-05]
MLRPISVNPEGFFTTSRLIQGVNPETGFLNNISVQTPRLS